MSLLRPFSKFFPQLQIIRRFSSEKPWQEVSIPVPWGQIRGKWWGPTDIRPILTIHGWQDSCGSFDRLIPLLDQNVGYLAIDLPGHGYSSRYPSGTYYYFTNYVLMIKLIREYFEWPKTSLLGHSMGGAAAYTYAMCYPKQVDFVACIDGSKPWLYKNRITYMTKALDGFVKNNKFALDTSEPPSYPLDDIKEKIFNSKPNGGSIFKEYMDHVLKRNIAPSKINPGNYYMTRDPRLKCGELQTFSQAELVECAKNMTCPIFIAKSKQSPYYEPKERFYEVLDILKRSSVDCDFHYLEGTHHAHLNTPEEVAALLNPFIQRHNIEDRSVGGIKEECIFLEEKESQREIGN